MQSQKQQEVTDDGDYCENKMIQVQVSDVQVPDGPLEKSQENSRIDSSEEKIIKTDKESTKSDRDNEKGRIEELENIMATMAKENAELKRIIELIQSLKNDAQ